MYWSRWCWLGGMLGVVACVPAGSNDVSEPVNTAAGARAGVPSRCVGNCDAATPRPPEVVDNGGAAFGNVTMYSTSPSNGGACLYGATAIESFAAIHVNLEPGDARGQWDAGRICGQCARVTVITSQGPKQVVVRIMDKCPDSFCGLDLGGTAPAAVMLDGFGRYDGGWEWISCVGHSQVFDGPTALFVKEGSNAYWAAVQVRNPPMSVASVQWLNLTEPTRRGGFEYAGPQIENYYLVPTELLRSPSRFQVTVTYRDGSTSHLELSGAQLAVAEASYPFPL
ncbi:MAG TPA: expansin-like protein [Polyangiaceae bacterium]|nr:expansin-like protein [Polyangiaceae bacterium]